MGRGKKVNALDQIQKEEYSKKVMTLLIKIIMIVIVINSYNSNNKSNN